MDYIVHFVLERPPVRVKVASLGGRAREGKE
jgi:hypothetical protein